MPGAEYGTGPAGAGTDKTGGSLREFDGRGGKEADTDRFAWTAGTPGCSRGRDGGAGRSGNQGSIPRH